MPEQKRGIGKEDSPQQKERKEKALRQIYSTGSLPEWDEKIERFNELTKMYMGMRYSEKFGLRGEIISPAQEKMNPRLVEEMLALDREMADAFGEGRHDITSAWQKARQKKEEPKNDNSKT